VIERLQKLTQARAVRRGAHLQTLWSGYGELFKAELEGADHHHVVVKHVRPPTAHRHPRGWNTSLSHERKLRSYDVEMAWYRDFAARCEVGCRVAGCLAAVQEDGEWIFVLEDLDAAGFSERCFDLGPQRMQACLRWLAYFHATFLGVSPQGLWPVGTYWHLDTRPDELEAVQDVQLKAAAPAIDTRLNNATFQTLVHGDAKVANFCFSDRGSEVAAVDFQYVGGGCGMKDVAYLLGSCLRGKAYERRAPGYVEDYFELLSAALAELQPQVPRAKVIEEWRALYPVACADFYRFLAGWAPDHWKMNAYSRELTRQVIHEL